MWVMEDSAWLCAENGRSREGIILGSASGLRLECLEVARQPGLSLVLEEQNGDQCGYSKEG